MLVNYVTHALNVTPPLGVELLARLVVIAALTAVMLLGLKATGYAAAFSNALLILPFAVMAVVTIPRVRAESLFAPPPRVDFLLFLHVAAWSFNGWESISTVAGEIKDAPRALPRAIGAALVLVVVSYLLPCLLLASSFPDFARYTNGYYATLAYKLGGSALLVVFVVGAVNANGGQFLSRLVSVGGGGLCCALTDQSTYLLDGMALSGLMPLRLGDKTAATGLPHVSFGVTLAAVLLIFALPFESLIQVRRWGAL
jgi:amino acid transporter